MTAKLPFTEVILLLLLQCCCLVVKAVTQGSEDLGFILGLRMPCLRLEKSLSGISCAKWAAVHIGMREKSRQGIAREKGDLEVKQRLSSLLCSE